MDNWLLYWKNYAILYLPKKNSSCDWLGEFFMLELYELDVFVRAAENLSFTAAAEQLVF